MQTVYANNRGMVADVLQVGGGITLNVEGGITITYNEGELEELRQKFTKAKEQYWFEWCERLRGRVNEGYFEGVVAEVGALVGEIEGYEGEGTAVNPNLKGKIYRLAAVAALPQQPEGDADLCGAYLAQAETFSQTGEERQRCQLVRGLLQYDTGETTAALVTLSEIDSDEALRHRFAILAETEQVADCQRLLDEGVVDLAWGDAQPDWTRAFLGFWTMQGEIAAAQVAAERLLQLAPTASSYQVAANCLLRLANWRVGAFCEQHEIFPDFFLGLDLSDCIDYSLQDVAASWFAKAGELYQQHDSPQAAVRMMSNAIRLALDERANRERLGAWTAVLAQLEPQHPLLLVLKWPEWGVAEQLGGEPTLLDFVKLLDDATAEPLSILKLATAVGQKKRLAAEVAERLQAEGARFENGRSATYAQYVFTVLQLWHVAKKPKQAKKWIKRASGGFTHSRLRPLLLIWHYLQQERYELAACWLEKALVSDGQHPEVMATAVLVYKLQENYEAMAQQAQALFGLIETRQTAEFLLEALWLTNQIDALLEAVVQVGDLGFDERYLRDCRIRAYVRRHRYREALPDLEWLYEQRLAQPDHLADLSFAYQLRGDIEQTIVVRQAWLEAVPEMPTAYLALAESYLHAGRYENAFEIAQQAADRFPDDPHVHINLAFIAFSTGHELASAVGEAFRALQPGGALAEEGLLVPTSLDELKTWVEGRNREGKRLYALYLLGKLPWTLFGLWRGRPLFELHKLSSALGEKRFVTTGKNHAQRLTRLMTDCPRQIVLDYTALLTIWSLFGRDSLAILMRYFDRVYLPERLSLILADEQAQLIKQGQRGRYLAMCRVRDALASRADKVMIHPDAAPLPDVIGGDSEIDLAEKLQLVYFHEHHAADEASLDNRMGIAAMAAFLYQAGMIDELTQAKATRLVKPMTEDEAALGSQLEAERACVVNLQTLESWAMRTDDLTPFFNYFDRIYVAAPAHRWLLAEIAAYKQGQNLANELQQLRRQLEQGVAAGVIVFQVVAETAYHLSQHKAAGEATAETDEDEPADTREGHWLSYYDELLGLAVEKQLPLWTDEVMVANSVVEGQRSPYSFSSDLFLALAHRYPGEAASISSEAYHAHYQQLVRWGYYFLPTNPEHILWYLRQGRQVDREPLASLLRHYREQLLVWWRMARQQYERIEAEGVQFLTVYQQQLLLTLYRLYKTEQPLAVCAAIFAELDLSRHAGELIRGNEPGLLMSLLFHALTADIAADEQDDSSEQTDSPPVPARQLLDYGQWLAQVMRYSDAAPVLIDEAWYQLLRTCWTLWQDAQTDEQQLFAKFLLKRAWEIIPFSAATYLLKTEVGQRLQQAFDLRIEEAIVFAAPHETRGTVEVRISTREWERDHGKAITQILQGSGQTAVAVGAVRVEASLIAAGSLFLETTILPTRIYQRYPDAQGKESVVFLLPELWHRDPDRREIAWRIGLTALQQHPLPVDYWQKLGSVLRQNDDAGQEAGLIAARYMLGQWPIAQKHLAQASQFGLDLVLDLLGCVDAWVVRSWLGLPNIDWTADEALLAWATELPLDIQPTEVASDFGVWFAHFSYSLFPDTFIWRQRFLDMLLHLPTPTQVTVVQQLLEGAEASVSLTRQANSVLLVRGWLATVTQTVDPLHLAAIETQVERLMVQVLRGEVRAAEGETAVGRLEPLLCRWLYQGWLLANPTADEGMRLGFAYLTAVGAGLIADSLAGSGRMTPDMIAALNKRLRHELQALPMNLRVEPQPVGYYRPVWRQLVNYPAAHMLHGLLAREGLPSYHEQPAIREAALQCGTNYRIREAFLTSDGQQGNWLDETVAHDVGGACLALLGELTEGELATWPEAELARGLVAANPASAIALAKDRLKALPELGEDEVFFVVSLAFQGRTQPNEAWFDLLDGLLQTAVLDKIRTFPRVYAEVLANLGLLWLEAAETCSPTLLAQIGDLLVEVPACEDTSLLLEAKAYVLTHLLDVEAGVGITAVVEKWLQAVAADERLDLATKRLALRPFTLLCPQYRAEIREPLYAVLCRIGELAGFQGVWEYGRLQRDMQDRVAAEKRA